MAESFGLCQIVGRPADGGELESLSALVVEKCDLLIVGPAHPAAGHDIGHRADIGIVDLRDAATTGIFFFSSALPAI